MKHTLILKNKLIMLALRQQLFLYILHVGKKPSFIIFYSEGFKINTVQWRMIIERDIE